MSKGTDGLKALPPHVRAQLRRDVCALYGSLCAYCGTRARLAVGTVDHYVPTVLGGSNEMQNLRWSCVRCNNMKGSMPPEAWERTKPPYRPAVTRAAVRQALLVMIAQRQRALSS